MSVSMMNRYFFTYGLWGHPFSGGWTEVLAPNERLACEAFRYHHPDKSEGLLNCSSAYTEENFKKTEMYEDGNFGARCHELIVLHIDSVTTAKEERQQ